MLVNNEEESYLIEMLKETISFTNMVHFIFENILGLRNVEIFNAYNYILNYTYQ